VIGRRIAWSKLIGSKADDAVEPGTEWRTRDAWRTGVAGPGNSVAGCRSPPRSGLSYGLPLAVGLGDALVGYANDLNAPVIYAIDTDRRCRWRR
jgi:hypothetical protein